MRSCLRMSSARLTKFVLLRGKKFENLSIVYDYVVRVNGIREVGCVKNYVVISKHPPPPPLLPHLAVPSSYNLSRELNTRTT